MPADLEAQTVDGGQPEGVIDVLNKKAIAGLGQACPPAQEKAV